MKLDKLTVWTFLGLTAVSTLIGGLGTSFLLRSIERSHIEIQVGANARQAEQVAAMLEQELRAGLPREAIIGRLEKSLTQAPSDDASFLCLMGKGGQVLCHPDPRQVGTAMETPPLQELPWNAREVIDPILARSKGKAGLLHDQTFGGATHILYQRPVAGADWMVAVHANLDLIRQRIARLRQAILRVAIPTQALIVLLGTLVARWVGRRHERRIQEVNAALERRVAERTANLGRVTLRYRSLFEGAASAIFLLDENRKIIEANRPAEELTGCSRRALEGRSFGDFCARQNAMPLQCQITFDRNNRQCVWEAKVNASPSAPRDVLVYENSIQLPGGALVQAIVQDMTEKKRLEAELRQSQKLQAVGQLAGGIAHDFNNLLCAINGYSEMARAELSEDSTAKLFLAEVLKAGRRAGDLTAQLLAFSRKQPHQPRALNLNDLINQLNKMLRRIIGERVQIQSELAPDLWPVLADPVQIEQVILNLAVNARDAMPEGGTLTLSTRNRPQADAQARASGQRPASDAVELAVTDTGCGIPDEIKDRLFEPFFTTKEQGKGTGLGLAVVHGIIEQHRGAIEIETRLQHGTTFRITLSRAEVETAAAEDDTDRPALQGKEAVLVVEDDPAVRTLAEVMLTRLGYRVSLAANADEALWRLAKEPGLAEMVLTDIVMPGMDVREFSRRLANAQPNLKIAYMTGYSDETEFLRELAQRGTTVLRKPFTAASLSEAVRQTLDSRPAFENRSPERVAVVSEATALQRIRVPASSPGYWC